jgi:hypothetical protein
MSKLHPFVAMVYELRSNLAKLRLGGLSIGADGRNRTLLSPYGSKTGRNQPSSTSFIFGNSKWMRSLIQAPPGRFLAFQSVVSSITNTIVKTVRVRHDVHQPFIEFSDQPLARRTFV